MARFIKNRSKASGQAPGSLILIGKQKVETASIHVMQYNNEEFIEKDVDTLQEAFQYITPDKVTWINIYGIHDMELIKLAGKLFEIPPLLMENLLNTDARPKYEDGENHDAFILKMLHSNEDSSQLLAEQITVLLGENYVLSFQERKGDVFAPVRERIRNRKGKIRSKLNDYLTYSLMDTIVDNYTIIIEDIGSRVEQLEDKIFLKKEPGIAEEIYTYKTELNFLRKSIRPVKDLMAHLLKSENSLFQESNLKFLHNLNDLVVHSTDTIELYNNMLSDQLNIYNTNVSNRMNEVMKVLTIFASIFIPLTFLAGIYGMNFEYLPELKYKLAYPIFWLIVLAVGSGLLVYFKRNKWL